MTSYVLLRLFDLEYTTKYLHITYFHISLTVDVCITTSFFQLQVIQDLIGKLCIILLPLIYHLLRRNLGQITLLPPSFTCISTTFATVDDFLTRRQFHIYDSFRLIPNFDSSSMIKSHRQVILTPKYKKRCTEHQTILLGIQRTPNTEHHTIHPRDPNNVDPLLGSNYMFPTNPT